jgi:N-acetylmuramoyl-L-alanine amidase
MKKRKAAVLAAAAFAITAACFLNSTQRAEAADNVVVMLDPGHDSTHTGAAAYGLKEQQLNLKIGLACRTELEKYDGITVYMTHDTIACPFEGSTTKQDLIQRAEYAGEVGADLFVSLHNNSGDDSGYEIYYPNNHYVSEFNDIGYAVSEHIAGYLSEMGIYRNGLYTRDSDGEEDDDTNWYPDGSRADYYSVIRNSKYNGVPGIIVEHAYLSDAGDTHVFLSNDNMLVRMGQADASGIADYFGLHKKNGLCTDKYGDWHYYEDGEIDDSYTGIAENEYGRWYMQDGVVNMDYTGMLCDGAEWYYVQGGYVNDAYTGMACNEYGWWYFEDGKLNWNYTGMALNEYGWWYFENGVLNWDYTGMVCNEYGWWYYQNGNLNREYTGMALNEYGWWYFENGFLNLNYTGMALNEYGWWYFENGNLNDAYTGMALNEYGWWYFENGQLNREYTGMAHNEYGWWYFENGLLNEEYTGIGANSYGEWYYQQGRIGYDFSGKVKFDDTEYTITEGYVVEKRIVNETEADTADTVHTAGTLPAGEESSTLGK